MRSFPLLFAAIMAALPAGQAQTPAPADSPPPTPAPYSEQTLAELARLQQAAVHGDYAYQQVAHLANNIGPRITGSPQAQKAVEYVAAELKALGLEVTLEPVMVPHWVRGEETAALTEFPGQAEGTTQKIVLTALGPSVATPPEGLTAAVVSVKDFHELSALGRDKVAGKIVLFNHPFDEHMAARARGWKLTARRSSIAPWDPAPPRASGPWRRSCARSAAERIACRTRARPAMRPVCPRSRRRP